MKKYGFGIFLILLFSATYAGPEQVVDVTLDGPEGYSLNAIFYDDVSWFGNGFIQNEKGVPERVLIYDMAIDYELNTITICAGKTPDDALCTTIQYQEGEKSEGADWKGGGQGEFHSIIKTTKRLA